MPKANRARANDEERGRKRPGHRPSRALVTETSLTHEPKPITSGRRDSIRKLRLALLSPGPNVRQRCGPCRTIARGGLLGPTLNLPSLGPTLNLPSWLRHQACRSSLILENSVVLNRRVRPNDPMPEKTWP